MAFPSRLVTKGPLIKALATTTATPRSQHFLSSTFRTFQQPFFQRRFSSSPSIMSGSTPFLEAIKARRTYYQITNESTISDEKIEEILKTVVLNVPSSFNSQSTRAVLLLKKEHEKLWDFTKEILKTIVPPEQFPATEQRINGFRAGYGTILFYEDPAVVQKLQSTLPLYADKFPQWSEHTSAMHQFALWTALETEGLGASLQHYNPLIDQKAASEWKIPAEWVLKGQLVFGKPTAQPGAKQSQPVEEKLFVHGK